MGGCYSAEMRRPAIRSTAHDPILSGKRQANLVDTWAFVTETTVIRREKFLFQSVLLLLGDWFGFNGKEKKP